MRVYNKSREVVEKAKKRICPRCNGFGAVTLSEESQQVWSGSNCFLCKGHGKVFISNTSGWTRAPYQRLNNSILW